MSLRDFQIVAKIGQGTYATVYKARRLTDNKMYALKQIRICKLDEKSKRNSLNEIRFLASFSCSDIIAYYEAFFEEDQNLLCIVMQYAEGGDLGKAIQAKKQQKQTFNELEIWRIMISLLRGIDYLHQRNILHRDVKPENIFITESGVKIGDLNVSKLISNQMKLTQTGTPVYASPEVWNNQPYDYKSDIWSIGCVIYQMAALKPPFIASSLQKLYEAVNKAKIKSIPKFYSHQLQTVINQCLAKHPSKRATIQQLFQNQTVKLYNNLVSTQTTTTNSPQTNEQSKKLLKTIIMNDPKLLSMQLPESKYKQTFIDGNLEYKSLCKEFQVKEDQIDTNIENVENLSGRLNKEQSRLRSKCSRIEQKSRLNSPLTDRQDNICIVAPSSSEKVIGPEKRRSSPRTELSVKRLRTIQSRKQPNPTSIEHPSLTRNKSKPKFDYKAFVMSKLPSNSKKMSILQDIQELKENCKRENIMFRQAGIPTRQEIFKKVKSRSMAGS